MPIQTVTPRRAKITGRTLHLYGPFDTELAAKVFEIPERERLAVRTLDLSDVDSLWADGALPVAADYLRQGKRLRVRCEGGPHVIRPLELHGWLSLFSIGCIKPDLRIPQRVQQFGSMSEIDAFVTASVRTVMQKVRCATDVLRVRMVA